MYTYLLHLSLSSFTNPSFTSIFTYTSQPQNKGVNDLAISVGTSVQEETSQPCLIFLLSLEYGIVMYNVYSNEHRRQSEQMKLGDF